MSGPGERFEPEQARRVNDVAETAADAEFEQALRRALRPVEVRAEFSAKLLALAAEAEQERVARGGGMRLERLSQGRRLLTLLPMRPPRMPSPRVRTWAAGLAAAALLAGVFGGEGLYERREHARGVAERRVLANQQFEASLRITDEALRRTRERLRRSGVVGVE